MDSKLKIIKECIKAYPDFPKRGVLFRDIFSVLREPDVFTSLVDVLVETAKNISPKLDLIVGLESRGFLIGPPIAMKLGLPFVPLRKKGKLPGETASVEFTLEYGTDILEVQKDSIQPHQSVLIVDDLIATGGSLAAACGLMKQLSASVAACLVVMELSDLRGREKIPSKVESLISY